MKGRHLAYAIALIVIFGSTLRAQTFSSGSTGADGAIDLTTGDQTLQLPPSGILNVTTLNVPAGRTLRFLRNAANTAVVILAQGDVTIGGVITVTAVNEGPPNNSRTPGPGGFYGGLDNANGFGPGGGIGNNHALRNGRWVGPLTLVPFIGGSGSAGTCGGPNTSGGGGGAIAIASSMAIVVGASGQISANGQVVATVA